MQSQNNQMETILEELYCILNDQRSKNKKKSMNRDLLAEMLCNELLQQNATSTSDPSFKQILQRYEVVSQTNLDLLYYDDEKRPKSYQFTAQEIKDNFMKCMDDMINGPYKSKLLTGITQNHIGLAISQAGQNGEKFQILAISTKKQVTLVHLVYCHESKNDCDSGLLFAGKICDNSILPSMLVIDKCTSNQIVVGPNLMMFSQETGELRIMIPDNYLMLMQSNNMRVSDMLVNNQGPHIVSLFTSSASDNSYNYGQGDNLPQDFTHFDAFTLSFNDILKDLTKIEQKNGSLNMLFNSQNSRVGFSSINNQVKTNQFTRSATTNNSSANNNNSVVGGPPIRSTRAQLMREQANLNKQQMASSNFNRQQQNNNFQNQKTPQANRTQFFNNTVNNMEPSQLNFTSNNNTSQFQSMNNNNMQGQNNKPFFVSFSNNNSENQNPNSSNNFNNQSQGFKPNFNFQNDNNNNRFSSNFNNNSKSFNNFYQQQNSTPSFTQQKTAFSFNPQNNNNNNMSIQFSNNSAFSKSNLNNQNMFKPNSNMQNPFSKSINNNAWSNNNANNNGSNNSYSWNNNNYDNGGSNSSYWPSSQNNGNSQSQNTNWSNNNNSQGFKPNFNSNSNWNNNFANNGNNGFASQPTIKFKFNPQPNQNPQSNNFSNNSNNNNQFATSFKPTFNFSNQNNNQNNQNNNIPHNLEQKQLFSDLSLIDQEQLKNYLKELSLNLNQEQIKQVTAMMLTDPIKFYDYYKIAMQEFQKSDRLAGSKQTNLPFLQNNSNSQLPQQNQNQNYSGDQILAGNKQVNKIDDMLLFLLVLPQTNLLKNEDQMKRFHEIMKKLTDGIIKTQDAVSALIMRKRQPINESFKHLYEKENQNPDLIIEHRGHSYQCHKLVFVATSDFFKKAVQESDNVNARIGLRVDERMPVRLFAPEWMDQTGLRLFIRFMYTNQIGKDGDFKQLPTQQLLQLLIAANFFHHEYLQELLVSEILIPNMTPISAVLYYKETLDQNNHRRKSGRQAWDYLKLYSEYYLAKHLPSLIRSSPEVLETLDSSPIRKLIDQSLKFIVDSKQDLEAILQYAADYWGEKSIPYLYLKSVNSMESCSAFDYQIVSQMGEFLQKCNPQQDYKCLLIKSQSVVDSKSISQVEQSKKADFKSTKPTDTTFIEGVKDYEKGNNSQSNDERRNRFNDLSNWKPSSNVVKGCMTTADLFDQKEPVLSISLKFEDIKAEFEKNQGVTMLFKPFDCGRRSWCLKLDIDQEQNVSVWIVERGNLINNNNSGPFQVGLNIPISFSSVLMQFELVDTSFGEHKSTMFHSYCHDQNQIIGHDRFINLSQLKDQNNLRINFYMKEYLLHSCLTHYVCSNFGNYFNQDLKKIDQASSNDKAQQKNGYYNQNYTEQKRFDLINIPFFSIYQIIQSSELNIDEEDKLLAFLFHYTQIQGLNHNEENMKFISNMLCQTLRFQFLSTRKILSALRDNYYLRLSSIFAGRIIDEFQKRINGQSAIIFNLNSQSASSLQPKIVPRKFYDLQKLSTLSKSVLNRLSQVGIPFQNNPTASKSNATFTTGQEKNHFIDELIDWLMHSKHSKENEAFVYQEMKKWQNLYYEEKGRVANLMSQFEMLKNQRKINGLIYSPIYLSKRGGVLRRSLSNDKTMENTKYNFNQNHQYQGQPRQKQENHNIQNRRRTPPKGLMNNQQQTNYFNQQNMNQKCNNQKMTNSFDNNQKYTNANYNYQYNHPNQYNNSIIQADNKLRSNQYLDFSRLLQNLETPPAINKRNQQQQQYKQNQQYDNYYYQQQNQHKDFEPYYRRQNNNAANRVRSQSDNRESECRIF